MANIKWSGLESWKYGLTARWYVSAYYGNDIDVDVVGYYNPTTNVYGHGGPTRPFASLSKLIQDSNISSFAIVILDSGYYAYSVSGKNLVLIGDGSIVVSNNKSTTTLMTLYNCTAIYYGTTTNNSVSAIDSAFFYCNFNPYIGNLLRCVFVECTAGSGGSTGTTNQCLFIRSSMSINLSGVVNTGNIFIECPNTLLTGLVKPRGVGVMFDYNVIIGTVRCAIAINGKTTNITVEDFKTDGNFNIKSFSEVDLFGNASGSGASVAQLQTIFNNYFSPIYLDTWQFADFSLKPTASDKIKFGGLNGTYIGAKAVGYHYNAAALWANRNIGNTSNIEIDAVTGYLQIAGANESGTLETNIIDLVTPIIVDPINFMSNLVYNSDGTAKQGVANQRIDTNPDALPNNTLNQRVVYDYEFSYSPNGVDALTAFKSFELNRKPTVDGEVDSQLDDNFSQANAQSITVQRFKIKFTLRKIVIA